MRVTTYRQFRMEVLDDGCYLSRHKSPEDAKAGRDGVEVASGVTLSRARTILRIAGATGPKRKPIKREPSPEVVAKTLSKEARDQSWVDFYKRTEGGAA